MVLVLFSGGVDSMVLAELAHSRGQLGCLLFIAYNQPASGEERRAAEDWAASKGYPLTVVHTPIMGVHEKMATGIAADGLRILPGRNLVMLSHAINVATVKKCSHVWYGANAGDSDYPDCSNEFLQAVNHVGSVDTGVIVAAPLLLKTKQQIYQMADQLNADISQAWSCYEPTILGEQCGLCHSCREGRQAVDRLALDRG